MGKPWFRIIGDVHQKIKSYIEIAKQSEYSLQIGDLGYDYKLLEELNPEHHKTFGGNHDNYSKSNENKYIHMQTGHWLGDYGIHKVPGFGEIFFIRGGRSIDWRYRIKGYDLFDEEELSNKEMMAALRMYEEVKPTYVFSHECPASITPIAFGQKIWDGEILKPSRTSNLLEEMWIKHSPKNWIFGHHHRKWSEEIRGTKFLCIEELGYYDFERKN